jgi:hypothetical protein
MEGQEHQIKYHVQSSVVVICYVMIPPDEGDIVNHLEDKTTWKIKSVGSAWSLNIKELICMSMHRFPHMIFCSK